MGALSEASSAGRRSSSVGGNGASMRLISSCTSDASALAAPGRHSGSAADCAASGGEDDEALGASEAPRPPSPMPAAASARLAAW